MCICARTQTHKGRHTLTHTQKQNIFKEGGRDVVKEKREREGSREEGSWGEIEGRGERE